MQMQADDWSQFGNNGSPPVGLECEAAGARDNGERPARRCTAARSVQLGGHDPVVQVEEEHITGLQRRRYGTIAVALPGLTVRSAHVGGRPPLLPTAGRPAQLQLEQRPPEENLQLEHP